MKKARNAPDIRIPTRIGTPRPFMGGAILAGLAGLVAATWGVTEWAAWSFRFNPSLGSSWHGIYLPFAWVAWWLRFAPPHDIVTIEAALHHAIYRYPPAVTATASSLPWFGLGSVAVGFLCALVVAAVAQRGVAGEEDFDDLFDTGAVWADDETARKDGLLGGKAGPIVAGFETANGDVVPLRHGGELGMSYTEVPGGGKSAMIKTNALINLQHEDAHQWSADERRLHPWGEEPVCVRADPKGEITRDCSGAEASILGRRVIVLAPLGVGGELKIPPEKLGRNNPYWSFALGTDTSTQDALTGAESIIQTAGKQDGTAHASHWDRATLGFAAGVIEKLGFYAFNHGQPELFSLPGLAQFVSGFKSLDALLEFMLTHPDDPCGLMGWTDYDFGKGQRSDTRVKPSIAQFSKLMMARDIKERSAIYSTLTAFLVKYFSDALSKYIQTCSFDWKTIANDPKRATSVNLVFDAMESEFLQPYLRQLIRSLFREVMRGGTISIEGRSARPNLRPIFLELDEAALLEKMDEFDAKSGFLRGMGIVAWLIWQSQSQRMKFYGGGSGNIDTMNETFGVHLYGAPRMVKHAKPIEEELGTRKIVLTVGNLGGDRFNLTPLPNIHEQTQTPDVPLMSAKRITQMAKDHYLMIYNGHNYYVPKWEYFRDPTLAKRSKIPYVKESEDCYQGREPYFITSLRERLSKADWETWMEYIAGETGTRPPGDANAPVYAGADVKSEETRGTGDDLAATERQAPPGVIAEYEKVMRQRQGTKEAAAP